MAECVCAELIYNNMFVTVFLRMPLCCVNKTLTVTPRTVSVQQLLMHH